VGNPFGRDRRRESWRRGRLAAGLTIVVVCIFGAAVRVSLAARAPDAPAERIIETPKAPLIRENGSALNPAGTPTPRKQMPRPIRIVIPSIKVSAPVIPLGLSPDRTLQVPTNFAHAGWFQGGPEPGETGPAVIVGHLASRRGPGVFYRLREVRVGELITIRLQDRSTVRYRVNSMVRVPKSGFPTKRVYAGTKQPTLRLITCAGNLNVATGRHPDNYIVFASLIR
jgi:LPXTG-site transpeptidase (sortase) family protein